MGHGAGTVGDFAIGIILVGCDLGSAAVDQIRHITLEIGDVVIGHRTGRAVGVGQGIGGSLGVVGKVQNLRCDTSICCCGGNCLPQQFSAGVDIAMLLGDGGFQNTLTAAAGGGRLILQTILGNGRIRGINGDNSCFIAISTTGTSEIDILDIFADFNIIVSQLFIISSPFTSPLQPDCCLCCHHVRKFQKILSY